MIPHENIKKAVIYIVGAIATALGILFGLSSCTLSRTITTTSESHTKGDTAVIIQSKTIESYHGSKQK